MMSSLPGIRVVTRCFSYRLVRWLAVAGWLAGANPGRAEDTPANAPAAAAHPTGSIPGYDVIRLGRGHFNRLCLAADVESTKGLMILDTGASHTVLSRNTYKFLLPDANRKLPAGLPATVSVNGAQSPVAVAREFRVGGFNLGAVPTCLVESRYLYDPMMLYQQDSARQYDGLLGEDLLRRYRAIVDCGRMALYLNTDPSRTMHLGPALEKAGWTRVEMENLGNDFVVPCTVNNHHFRVVVDTGSPFTDFDRSMMLRAELDAEDTRMSGGVIGTRASRTGIRHLDSWRIGDYTAFNTLVMAHDGLKAVIAAKSDQTSNPPMLGLLGGDFLAKNNAMIDVGDHALYLKPTDASGEAAKR